MRIDTKFLGEIDIDEQRKVCFPKGLFGFENCTEFVILNAEQPPFYYFQSLENKDICFILLDPFLFRPDYEADIAQEEMNVIGIQKPEQAAIFVIVTIPNNDAPMTANLQGPLVINEETKRGCQIVLTDPRWKTKHDILAERAESRKTGGQRPSDGRSELRSQPQRKEP
ncbi:MAG: flagellar assembly protein FliW [Treponema sp.]|jgi:flagellar assembly factor FliW|nr:flagellar assembly protein FliW [Treponema sp.]